jgi:hypothetical protein
MMQQSINVPFLNYTIMSCTFDAFISFPDYAPTLRSHKITSRGYYTSLDDVIHELHNLYYEHKYISEVSTAFRKYGYLADTLQNVRACVIQIKPMLRNTDWVCVLENRTLMHHSDQANRVIYLRMHDYVNERQKYCQHIRNIIICGMLGLFAIIGIIVSLTCIIEMLASSEPYM